MKKMIGLAVISLLVFNPGILALADEDHAHEGIEDMHKGMQGMGEEMGKMHAEHAATLREAASGCLAGR